MYGEIVYNLLETKNLPWVNCFLFLIASGSDSLNKTNPELSIKLMTELKGNSSKSIFPSCEVNMMKLHTPVVSSAFLFHITNHSYKILLYHVTFIFEVC